VFDMSLGEMLVIGVIVLVVFKPEQLPEVMRHAGRLYGKVKGASDDLRRAFNTEVARVESERRRDELQRRREELQKRRLEPAADAVARAGAAPTPPAPPAELPADAAPRPVAEGAETLGTAALAAAAARGAARSTDPGEVE